MSADTKVKKKIISPTQCSKQLLRRMDGEQLPFDEVLPVGIVLYDVFGTVKKARVGSTDKGVWIVFVGEFEAITPGPGGTVFTSTKLYVDQPLQNQLFAALEKVQNNDAKAAVEFSARVSIVQPKKGKPSPLGYDFKFDMIVGIRESDPMSVLRETTNLAHLMATEKDAD